jgi:Nucleotidyl transferase AbiEii toxin, Type IV TA system
MRLFEHPDFEQAVLRAAEHFRARGLREAIIEKDYYVTEALGIIEQAAGPQVIFNGATSLSKGRGLIQRFSEDIDIFLDPTAGSSARKSSRCSTPRNTRPSRPTMIGSAPRICRGATCPRPT